MKDHSSRPSIDGFTLRRQTSDVGGLERKSLDAYNIPTQSMRSRTERAYAAPSSEQPEILPRPEIVQDKGLRRADIGARRLCAGPDNKPADRAPGKIQADLSFHIP